MTEAPKGYEPDHPPVFDGGTPGITPSSCGCTSTCGWPMTGSITTRSGRSGARSRALYFNTNGHAYHGLEDWLHIWDHYRTRLQLVKRGGSGPFASPCAATWR